METFVIKTYNTKKSIDETVRLLAQDVTVYNYILYCGSVIFFMFIGYFGIKGTIALGRMSRTVDDDILLIICILFILFSVVILFSIMWSIVKKRRNKYELIKKYMQIIFNPSHVIVKCENSVIFNCELSQLRGFCVGRYVIVCPTINGSQFLQIPLTDLSRDELINVKEFLGSILPQLSSEGLIARCD